MNSLEESFLLILRDKAIILIKMIRKHQIIVLIILSIFLITFHILLISNMLIYALFWIKLMLLCDIFLSLTSNKIIIILLLFIRTLSILLYIADSNILNIIIFNKSLTRYFLHMSIYLLWSNSKRISFII